MISEAILEDYFIYLSTCDYSKARRIMESILVYNKNESKSGMYKLLNVFIIVLNLEKKYYSLEFLNNKRKTLFSRKENQSEGYGDLMTKIKNIDVDKLTIEIDNLDIYKTAKSSIFQICDIRFRMTEMYIMITQLGKSDGRKIIDLFEIVRPIKEYLKDLIAINILSGLRVNTPLILTMELEIDALMCLAEAQHLISNLYFLVPINLLHSANEKCQQLIQTCSPLTTSSRLFSRQSQSLQLPSWLIELYNFSLAKYTLYFYPVIIHKIEHLPPDNSTSYESHAFDLVQRITAFVKKASALSVLLVFDATKQNHPFLGHGYVLPSSVNERLSGLHSYPVIFSCPTELKLSRELHCSIVMLIGRIVNKLSRDDNIEYLAEPDGSKTYFVARIDFRVYLILLFNEKRDREKLIINFIENIHMLLNGKSIIDQLISFTL